MTASRGRTVWVVLAVLVSVLLYPLSFRHDPPLNHIKTGDDWHNWVHTVRAKPSHIRYATTHEEIVSIIKEARGQNAPIKVVGSGHSWNHVAAPQSNGYLLNLSKYNKILRVDKEARQVTLQSGVTINQLVAYLHAHGLALHNLGHIDAQTFSGAISTGTHGSGLKHGLIASHIINMTLVDAEGVTHVASASENPDLFHAGLLGLGSLGVISTITLQARDAFNIVQLEKLETLDHIMNTYEQALEQNDYYQFWWIPLTDKAKVFYRNMSEGPAAPFSAFQRHMSFAVDAPYYSFFLWLETLFPSLRAFINKHVIERLLVPVDNVVSVKPSFIQLTDSYPDMYEEMELHIPLAQFPRAFNIISTFINTTHWNVNFIVGVRFIPADHGKIWLSPAYDGPCAAIAVMMYRQPQEFRQFIAELQDELRANQITQRPHWGKLHNITHTELHDTFSHYDDFLSVRQQMDPNGVFLNDYLREIFAL